MGRLTERNPLDEVPILSWDVIEECLGKQAVADLVGALRGPVQGPGRAAS